MKGIAVLVSLSLISAGSLTSPRADESVPAGIIGGVRQSPHHQDQRFNVLLTMESRVCKVGELLGELGKKGGTALLAFGDWPKKTVGISVEDVPAATIMDAVEIVCGGHWYLIDGYWVLAPAQGAAQNAVQQEQARAARAGGPNSFSRGSSQRLVALVASFSLRQWDALAQGKWLTPADLTPQQSRLIQEALLLEMRDPAGPHVGTPRQRALKGDVQIWLRQSQIEEQGKRRAGPFYLNFAWPTVARSDDNLPSVKIPVVKGSNDQWTVAGTLQQPTRTGAPSQQKASATLKLADYHENPCFSHNLVLGKEAPTAEILLRALEHQVGSSFLVEGAWLRKPLRFAVRDRSVADVMDSLAKLTGRRWVVSGSIWVLAPQQQ